MERNIVHSSTNPGSPKPGGLIVSGCYVGCVSIQTVNVEGLWFPKLKEAAVIPISEYIELLKIAERFEDLAVLEPLIDDFETEHFIEFACVKENLGNPEENSK